MTSPTSSPTVGERFLAISFGGPGGSLALGFESELFESEWTERATSSELATVKLAELLDRANLPLAAITHLVVNVGPGSFTGIRVAVNLARTLGYALDRPVAGVDSLRTLAHREQTSALIALKAVRNEFYAARFTGGLDLDLGHRSLSRAELDHHPGALIEGETPDFDPFVRARDLIALARAGRVQFSSWREVGPLYIRGSEAEEKLKKGLLKPV